MRVKLTPGDLDRLDAVMPKGVAAGARYHEHGMSTLDR
jgi:hypothetical protein